MNSKKINSFLSLLLFFQIALIYIFSKFPYTIEKYYSQGIYLYLSPFLRKIFGWIPFSFGDLIYLILFVLVIKFIYKIIRKKGRKQTLINFLAGFSIFYFFFYLFWGLNYSRLPITNTLKLEKEKFKIEQLKSLTDKLISKTSLLQFELTGNDTLPVVVPYSKNKIIELTQQGYQKLATKFKPFKYKPSSLKKSLFSIPLTYMGFAGYFNPFTGEAQIDYLIPKVSLPMTCSHEVAHQLGIASESEANFIGYLAANFHQDKYFQYSANLMAIRYALSDIYRYDENLFKKYMDNLPKGIVKNIKETQEFWIQYQNFAEPIFKTFYDNYLKVNQQKDGLESYNRMVDLLIAFDSKYELK